MKETRKIFIATVSFCNMIKYEAGVNSFADKAPNPDPIDDSVEFVNDHLVLDVGNNLVSGEITANDFPSDSK